VKRGARTWSAAALAWAVVIVVVGVAPTQQIVSAAAPDHETASTLVGHFVEYFVLAVLITAAWGRPGRIRGATMALTVAVGLGAVIEVVQAFLPYRDCQAIDVLVNAAGAACGVVSFSAVSAVRVRRRSRRS
jgi:VanZ family protein